MHADSGRDALTALDVCAVTDQQRHLPRAVEVLLRRISGEVRMERLDAQTYVAYSFGAPDGR